LRIVEISSIPRIEGHAALELVVDPRERRCLEVRLRVFEGPRLFEYILRGRMWWETPWITSRICGVCGYAHAVCSAQAVEDALGVEVDEDAAIARELALRLNTIDSHLLHLALLMLPDIHGVERRRDIVRKIIKLRGYVGRMARMLFGDRVHPRAIVVGGVVLPQVGDLGRAAPLAEEVSKLAVIVEEFGAVLADELEELRRVSRMRLSFVAASPRRGCYLLGGDEIIVDASFRIPRHLYRRYFSEVTLRYSTSRKSLLYGRDPFIVGAGARLSTYGVSSLGSEARSAAQKLGVKPPATSPVDIPLAQAVEVVGLASSLPQLLEEVPGRAPHTVEIRPAKGGTGVGVIEAPRGMLYHSYTVARDGRITASDIVTPTAHNIASMEVAVANAVNTVLSDGAGVEEVKKVAELVVRSADPCISCAVHVVVIESRS